MAAIPGSSPPLAGVVLCGGRGRRMGADKALLELDGEPLVARAVRRLRDCADPVLLACGSRALAAGGCRCVVDPIPGGGPLGGLVAGLRAAPHQLSAVVAVDMPWLDAGLLGLLAAGWGGEDVIVPVSPSGPEPLHAVYSRSAVPLLEEALAAGRLRLLDALGHLRTRHVEAAPLLGAEPAARFATNINTPADLLSLRRPRPRAG